MLAQVVYRRYSVRSASDLGWSFPHHRFKWKQDDVRLIGVGLLVTGIGLFLLWLFGGIIIGIFFTFTSRRVLGDLALTKILAPILIVVSNHWIMLRVKVPVRYAWFRVPPQTKLRLSEKEARIDVRPRPSELPGCASVPSPSGSTKQSRPVTRRLN